MPGETMGAIFNLQQTAGRETLTSQVRRLLPKFTPNFRSSTLTSAVRAELPPFAAKFPRSRRTSAVRG
jgi:hypothetical protein